MLQDPSPASGEDGSRGELRMTAFALPAVAAEAGSLGCAGAVG